MGKNLLYPEGVGLLDFVGGLIHGAGSHMSRLLVYLVVCAMVVLCPALGATWSIIICDVSTGEVAVGTATCLTGMDIGQHVPLIVVGKGGACAQSAIDSGAVNRKKIWNELMAGTSPAEIIEIAKQGDLLKGSRQYGVADMSYFPASWSGGAVMGYKGNVTGQVNSVVYAIQGNVITGAPAIDAAVQAVEQTEGSVADKLMAGMQAAQIYGGDGRCSCPPPGSATSCGSPPTGWDPATGKSAHIGFMAVARMGDTDGICNAALGCASGDYWLRFNVKNQQGGDPDPVVTLKGMYDDFVLAHVGHADGVKSYARLDDDWVLGEAPTTRQLHVVLYDINGDPVTRGGAILSVTHAEGSAGLSSVQGVTDHGNGAYTVDLLTGAGYGRDRLAVEVDDGEISATIYPYPELWHRERFEVSQDYASVEGDVVSMSFLAPPGFEGRRFAMFLSLSGGAPGIPLENGAVLPLNPHRLFAATPLLAQMGVITGIPGTFDGSGRGRAGLRVPPGLFSVLEGLTVWAAWLTFRPADAASNVVGIDLRP